MLLEKTRGERYFYEAFKVENKINYSLLSSHAASKKPVELSH
jgi:hypothetical protein